MKPTFGSLFAGIGGFDLGFERAGWQCSWQVEIDPWCRRVLAKHWPDVKRHDDVRTFPEGRAEEWQVDCIIGGFPCQDISDAGKRVGIGGERSGLWSEYARIIRVVRPKYIVVENVAALLYRGMGRVLGDLASCGYDAEWDCIPAGAFGAHFPGQRVFIVASNTETACLRREGRWEKPQEVKCPWRREEFERLLREVVESALPAGKRGCLSDGVSNRVDRLRGLGNAVVPQVAEWIARRLLERM